MVREHVQSEDHNSFLRRHICSLVIRLRYGAFDYYTGGDISGVLAPGLPAWYQVETPVVQVVGPVEVSVLNHHGNKDGPNANFVRSLRPRTFILPVWSCDHPAPWVVERMYSTYLYQGHREVFATDMMEVNKVVIGPSLQRLTSNRGHIAVRVVPSGNTNRVIILDDSKEGYSVTGVYGPYDAR